MTPARDMVKTPRPPWILIAAGALLLLTMAFAVWRTVGGSAEPRPPPGAPLPVTPPRVTIAPAPPATQPAAPLEPVWTESSILLPLELKLGALEPFVEAAVPRKFDQTLNLGAHGPARDVRAVLDLIRGDVTLTPRGDRLAFSFPLKGRIPVKARIDPGFGDGFAAGESIDNVRGTVSGWVKLGVDARWNVVHESGAAMDVDKAEVKFPLGITIGVRERLEEQTKTALGRVLREKLDEAVARLKLRERAGGVWLKLHTTHRVSETPHVAMTFRPLSVRMRPLRFDDDGVARLALSVSGQTSTRFDEAATDAPPTADAPPTPLPNLLLEPAPRERFHVALAASVRVSDLTAVNRPPLELADRLTFTTKGARLLLGESGAVAAVEFEASREAPAAAAGGTLYLAGTLAYDPRDNALRLSAPRYDPRTQAALASAAPWLLEPAVLQALAASVAFPVDAAVKDAEAGLRAQLARIRGPAGLDLGLTVDGTQYRDLRPTGQWVHLLFDVKGTSRATLQLPHAATN